MKQKYQAPNLTVVQIQVQRMLSGSLQDIGGNSNIGYGGGSDDEARARGDYGDWDDDF